MVDEALARRVADVRAFNRLYTLRIGLLGDGLHDSPFSLTEVRVLYEIAERTGLTAATLARELRIDPAYLSRMIKKFKAAGLIDRRPAESDRREWVLTLTKAGRDVIDPLIAASNGQVAEMLSAFDAPCQETLIAAMRSIREILEPENAAAEPWMIRPHRPGDIGWIVHRHGVLYSRDYGWNANFEGFVAEIAGKFAQSHDASREHCWIAERHGDIIGSVFLMRQDDQVAKLRLLYVEPAARGLGVGRRLVEQCLHFARSTGYRRVVLWTNDGLTSARRIYEAAGFQLVAEEPHSMFGPPMVGQDWELGL
jgi:DNA-binding MarR family transcriptional regulator/ribosomal protein S18 acetylase RimI-like enzyme